MHHLVRKLLLLGTAWSLLASPHSQSGFVAAHPTTMLEMKASQQRGAFATETDLLCESLAHQLYLLDQQGMAGPGRALELEVTKAGLGSKNRYFRLDGLRLQKVEWLSLLVPVLQDGTPTQDRVEIFFRTDLQHGDQGRTTGASATPIMAVLHRAGGEREVLSVPG